jgi:lipooligosaccharide transport system permease protein
MVDMKDAIRNAISDMARLPRAGRGVLNIWKRNFRIFRLTLLISLFWIVLEPCLYLFGIGKGIGYFVGDIHGESYLRFFFPALLASTSMFVAFFETTYGTYSRLTEQKSLNTILLTPISPSEIALGEIFWASFKGFLSAFGVVVVTFVFGLKLTWGILPVLFIMWMNAWVFAALGLLFTTWVSNWDYFLMAQSGLLIPMSLFSGTYFPLDEWPRWVQSLSLFFPLTHSVHVSRLFLRGQLTPILSLHIATLLFFAMILTNWSVARLERKLFF